MPENTESKDKDASLPDSENCRAKRVVDWDYSLVDCLIENPLCKFALYFGSGVLCRHPRRKEIVERTKAMFEDSERSG
jgi:hypothetical protein